MNFFEYVDLMKEKSTPVAIVGLGLLALFLVVIIFKMFGGIRRGTWRQLVRTGMTLIAAVVSYLAALYLSNSIIGGFKVEKVGEVDYAGEVMDVKVVGKDGSSCSGKFLYMSAMGGDGEVFVNQIGEDGVVRFNTGNIMRWQYHWPRHPPKHSYCSPSHQRQDPSCPLYFLY